jgi:predicted O-methyltransferase YrrM
MDSKIQTVLEEYEQRAVREAKLIAAPQSDALTLNRDEMLLPVGPATGALLNLLIKEAKAKRILEFGTSFGYASVWLGEAARTVGGKVTTLEIHAGKAEYARAMWARAGLADSVECVVGDAQASVAGLSGPFDFVLIDLWKDLYIPCFDLVYPKLAPGAIVVADNMLFPEIYREGALAYRNFVKAKSHMTSVLLPVGSGIELSRYRAD